MALNPSKEKYRSTAGIKLICGAEEMLSFKQSSVASDTQDLIPLSPIQIATQAKPILLACQSQVEENGDYGLLGEKMVSQAIQFDPMV